MASRLFLVFFVFTNALCALFIVRPPSSWEAMSPQFLIGAITLSCAMLCHATAMTSWRRAAALFGIACAIAWAAEAAGMRSPWLFGGRYAYHPLLVPTLPGGVPLFIPLAWFAMAYTPRVLLRTFAAESAARNGPIGRSASFLLSALYPVALDLTLDPLGVQAGLWTWDHPGTYFGTPPQNFLGWFLTGCAIQAAWRVTEPADRGDSSGSNTFDTVFAGAAVCGASFFLIAGVLRLHSLVPSALSLLGLAPAWIGFRIARRKHEPSQKNTCSP